MTRTTDDLHPDGPWRPLGETVVKAPPPKPEPKPQGPSGIVIDEHGMRRTTTHPKDPKP